MNDGDEFDSNSQLFMSIEALLKARKEENIKDYLKQVTLMKKYPIL